MTKTADMPILNFNLFGETGDLPDVAHCETIEARSLLHDWEFAPHRHARLHQILFIESGSGQASLDGKDLELKSMMLVNVPIGVVHGFTFKPGTVGLVVTLAAEIFDVVLQATEGLHQVLSTSTTLVADSTCVRTMHDIYQTFTNRDFARAQILRSQSGLLLGQIARIINVTGAVDLLSPHSELLTKFVNLLETHFVDHWPVADYAHALGISPTHLSRVTRSATGLPASKLIEERIILEARRNLVYTNLSISTVAYELGYADPSYFSRIFSQVTGLSPKDFRSRYTEGAVS